MGQWLIYTVAIGLIPMLMRLAAWAMTKMSIDAVVAADFIAFGLVLHVSMINQLEEATSSDILWKKVINGASILFIVFYAVMYVITLIADKKSELVDIVIVNNFTYACAFLSLAIGSAVAYRFAR
ncbi:MULTISPECIES: hypothetical protein [Comamonas]|uniref:hypothetical protein n=1 Tax=Comamonas TaxID=283 RepID=UPI0006B9319C|nr:MULTISPECIES: hypothetical protein [Comamonas]